MTSTGTDTGAQSGDRGANATETEPATEQWYRSPWLVAAVGVDVALMAALAAGTTVVVQGALGDGIPGAYLVSLNLAVPWEVYAFAVLGALAYVFTALVRDFDRSAERLVRYHLRVPAAVPLAAGTYLLADLILGAARTPALVAGLAFVTGLYVNLAYHRLAVLAERLLPSEESTDEKA